MVRSLVAILTKAIGVKTFTSYLTMTKIVHPPASPATLIQQVVDVAIVLRAAGFDLDEDIGESFEEKSPQERAEAHALIEPYTWLFDEMATLAAMVNEHVEWLNPNPDGDPDTNLDSGH